MADLDAKYRKILIDELASRQKKNSRYSLRSFARHLKCDPTFLSKLSAGKIILSVDRSSEFAKLLKLSEQDTRSFILSAAEEQRCHALYLLDPNLTDCERDETSSLPKRRSNKESFR